MRINRNVRIVTDPRGKIKTGYKNKKIGLWLKFFNLAWQMADRNIFRHVWNRAKRMVPNLV